MSAMPPLKSKLNKINQSQFRVRAIHRETTARWFVLDYEKNLFYYADAADTNKNWSGVTTLAMIDKVEPFKYVDGQDFFGFAVWVNDAVHVQAICPSSATRSSKDLQEEWVGELNRARQTALKGTAVSPGHPTHMSTGNAQSANFSSRCETEDIVKWAIIGDSNSGKTLLARNYVGVAHDGKCTIGIDYLVKREELNGNQVKLQIYDTAGQEKFTVALPRMTYRECQVFFIMFDLSRQESFNSCPHWLQQVRDHCCLDHPIIFLVGNKRDLTDKRKVSVESATAFARASGLEYFETSALLQSSSLELSGAANADASQRTINPLGYLFKQALERWNETRPNKGPRSSIALDPGRNFEVDEATPGWQTCRC